MKGEWEDKYYNIFILFNSFLKKGFKREKIEILGSNYLLFLFILVFSIFSFQIHIHNVIF